MHDQGLDIYLIAIGGTGMAPLACLLKEAGHRVRGSDGPLYPPMSTILADAGIEPLTGFDPAHLEPAPDLVIVGNAVPRTNPEVEAVEAMGLPKVSMPQALARFLLENRRPLVVAGTHGKTTTTSLAAWVWEDCGRAPGFLVGGIPKNLVTNFRLGDGERFIIEGDEYNAAYFDRGPKFLHYRAETLILTSVEFDHADLYANEKAASAAYEELLQTLPANGLLVACGDSPGVRRIAHLARCQTVFYGLGEDNHLRPLAPFSQNADGLRLQLEDPDAGKIELALPMQGEHSATNALAVWAAARADSLAPDAITHAMSRFEGVKRRAELVGTAGEITIIDDFAHHPTAVRVTLAGLKARFPGRKLIAIFEPRSLTSARNLHFAEYCQAFRQADEVMLAPVFHAARFADDERLDTAGLIGDLASHGIPARLFSSVENMARNIAIGLEPGDVVVTMSSGSFGGLPQRLLEILRNRSERSGSATS
ncbi:MAG: Mur ligase family protein [Acidobacteriota bacterium]|nr:Mur ligase family protein [Acidobacteriota bacterium]